MGTQWAIEAHIRKFDGTEKTKGNFIKAKGQSCGVVPLFIHIFSACEKGLIVLHYVTSVSSELSSGRFNFLLRIRVTSLITRPDFKTGYQATESKKSKIELPEL